MKKVVFIVSKLSQPRCIKRIQSIIEAGNDCRVYGFEDGSYNTDLTKLPFNIEEVLTTPRRNGKRIVNSIVGRVYPYYKLRRILSKEGSNSIYYVFGFDLAKILYRLGCKNFIYEEADINSSKYSSKIKRLLSIRLDKKIALRSLLTVYTSKGFVDFLFKESKKPNFLVLPNKLSSYFANHERDRIKSEIDINKLRFGFIGLIRYPETIFRFAKVVSNHFPMYEFHFYGGKAASLTIPEELQRSGNVFFHGPFSNPEDLEDIYKAIDINIACYDTLSQKNATNVKVAEPNKLYESIYFKTPLIVSQGTYVGERVSSMGIGKAVDSTDENSILSFIKSLTIERLNQMVLNAERISKNDLIDNPNELTDRIYMLVQE